MNKVMLLGRLTKDPEVRYTQVSNSMITTFTLAINRKFAKEGEERQADFFNIVAWNKLAETAFKYLKKGMQVFIVGRLQTRYWEDEEGQKHYVTEIICEEIEFVENKKSEPNSDILDGKSPTSQCDNNAEEILSGDDLPF